jgi:hypothetical protein
MSTALSGAFLARTLLHEASRRWDAEGHIMAAIVDYAALRTLAAYLVSGGAAFESWRRQAPAVEAALTLPAVIEEGG